MKSKVLLAATLAIVITPFVFAQAITCPPLNQDLVKIPEITSSGGKLKGTIILDATQVNIPFRVPISAPTPMSSSQCFPQWVRILRGVNTTPAYPPVPADGIPLPMPGPTLRARVGDLVQLTFLNQIDPGKFPYSIDRGDTVPGGGCDETTVYPKNVNDKYPNCFHGSSTANMHFHGTHTNPGSTGDNVFVEIRPSLRKDGNPVVTEESVKADFDKFFGQCEQMLAKNVLRQWPKTWDDLPQTWIDEQLKLLKDYDDSPRVYKTLRPIDEKQHAKGQWPQYYIGAYPYCFRLPEYKDTKFPPSGETAEETHDLHMQGQGSAEEDESDDPKRPLLMGQAPGTHWYHAHKHGSTAINVANGMTGAFIIEGKYDDEINAVYGANWTRTQPVLVVNQLGVSPNLERTGPGRQDKGPSFAVNGRLQPVIKMKPGEVQMWRIVNTSGRAGMFFSSPPVGFEWMQLAQDGVQFSDPNYQNSLNKAFFLMSGNRADILVKAPDSPTNGLIPLLVQNFVDPQDLPSAAQLVLLNVNVAGTAVNMDFLKNAPSFPPFLADIQDSEITGTKKLLFSSTSPGKGGHHFVNGKPFSGEVGEVILLNTVEEWKVLNATYGPPISHPFHIHINPFQVVEFFNPNDTTTDPSTGLSIPRYVFDKAALKVADQCYLDPFGNPDDWKPCGGKVLPPVNNIWWDVFPIPSGVRATDAKGNAIKDPKTGQQIGIPGYFKMRSRFVDYSGYYVLHCHILAHEDRGMMTVVEVAPLQSPYSHH